MVGFGIKIIEKFNYIIPNSRRVNDDLIVLWHFFEKLNRIGSDRKVQISVFKMKRFAKHASFGHSGDDKSFVQIHK
jgi:hypothetical protein